MAVSSGTWTNVAESSGVISDTLTPLTTGKWYTLHVHTTTFVGELDLHFYDGATYRPIIGDDGVAVKIKTDEKDGDIVRFIAIDSVVRIQGPAATGDSIDIYYYQTPTTP